MMKSKLLLVVAAVALTAGTGAIAQQENRAAPAEKSGPSTMSKPNSGAVQQNRNEPGGRGGQSGRPETTGQAPQERSSQEGSTEERSKARNQDRSGADNKAPSEENKANKRGPERANRGDRDRPAAAQEERSNRNDRSRSTTGQAPSERRNDSDRRNDNVQINRDRENGADRDRTTIDRDSVQGDRNENRATVNEGRSSTSTSVNLTEQQRTRIHEVIVKERGAPRANNVNFALTIGSAVPRSVKLVRVPSTIAEIEPAWRDFEYFLVGEEIVIVDPRRMEIVAVVPA
jgi:hypothetical protein